MEDRITTNNYLLIKIVDAAEQSAAGIYIPEKHRDIPRWGWVLDVGEGVFDITGKVFHPPFEPGDLVYFMMHAPEKMDYSDKGLGVLHFVSEGDIQIKLKVGRNDDGTKTYQLMPIGNYVEIEPMEDMVRKQTEGGIFLPDQIIDRPSVAKVISVGPGQRTMTGYGAPRVKPGDVVRYRMYSSQTIKFESLGLDRPATTIIPYGDVLAVEVPDFENLLKSRIKEYADRLSS